jgi:hypothetical protein
LGGRLDRHLPRRAERSVALSERAQALLFDWGCAEVALLPPGVEPEDVAPCAPAALPPGDPWVIYTVNPDRYQELDVLLAAMAQVPEADFPIYLEAMTRYGKGTNALGAATVSFRDAMNLWAVMDDVGTDVTGAKLIAALRAAKDAPSFGGHPYTCDGRQIPAMPALCAPQQVIAQIELFNNTDKYPLGVYVLPKALDEKVATLHLGALGAVLTKLSDEQSDYLGIPHNGPFKSENYRY